MACSEIHNWEVLNGVGVDGVGVTFPFFNAFFPFFYAFFPFFYAFFAFFPFFYAFFSFFFASPLFLLKDKGKQQQFTAKMGNFTPTPSAPTPSKLPDISQGAAPLPPTGSLSASKACTNICKNKQGHTLQ